MYKPASTARRQVARGRGRKAATQTVRAQGSARLRWAAPHLLPQDSRQLAHRGLGGGGGLRPFVLQQRLQLLYGCQVLQDARSDARSPGDQRADANAARWHGDTTGVLCSDCCCRSAAKAGGLTASPTRGITAGAVHVNALQTVHADRRHPRGNTISPMSAPCQLCEDAQAGCTCEARCRLAPDLGRRRWPVWRRACSRLLTLVRLLGLLRITGRE
jgi:hypothetical protein